MREKSTQLKCNQEANMIETKIYRGQKRQITPEHKEVNNNDLVYRGVSANTNYFDLAKVRASHVNRKSPLFYRGVAY